ncbi:MAG TPA: rod shape-determining protein MreD, partial [Egibacteraceae bacterium]|nr:rod shape-determining protein MreD [Egibacteraceae bacterium]
FGHRPDLLVLFVVAVAYHDGPASGARAGFAAGLIGDLLSSASGPVGVGALVLLLVGHAVGVLRPYLSGTALAGQLAVATGATLVAVLGYGFLGLLLDVAPADPALALQTAATVALYNALLAPFVFAAVRRLSVRFPRSTTVPASPWSPGRVSGQQGRP